MTSPAAPATSRTKQPRPLGARLNAALAELLLLSDVPALNPERNTVSTGRGGHGTHKERGQAPIGTHAPFHERPLVEQYAERFQRLIEAAERDVEGVRRGNRTRRNPRDTRSAQYRAEVRAILAEEGRDPVWVAFVYGWTEDAVRRLRKREGRDPDTGERARRNVLTASTPPAAA